RRYNVASCTLDGLDKEGAELGVSCFGVPCAGVLVLEQSLHRLDAIVLGLCGITGGSRTKRIGKRDELRSVGQFAEPFAVAIRRSDRGSAESPAVIAPLECQHVLAPRGLPYQFQGVLNCLRAPNIELDPSTKAEPALDAVADHGGQFDLLPV